MIRARRQAIESAQTALDAARKGLERGMKTQIDVLQAQQQLAFAKKEFFDAQLGAFANEITLFALAGVLTNEYVKNINEASIEKF